MELGGRTDGGQRKPCREVYAHEEDVTRPSRCSRFGDQVEEIGCPCQDYRLSAVPREIDDMTVN